MNYLLKEKDANTRTQNQALYKKHWRLIVKLLKIASNIIANVQN